MKRTVAFLLAGVILASAGAAPGAEAKPEEDETLPRPLKGQTADYYASLARVHAAFGHYEVAEKLHLRALEVERDPAEKQKLSFELVDRIYMRAGRWDKAAAELLRTLSLVDKGDVDRLRKYHLARAMALAEAGRPDEQVKEIETVVALSRNEREKHRAYQRLHVVLKAHGWLKDRVRQYEAHVEKHPDDKDMLRMLAGVYHGTGLLALPGRAIEKYEQILKFAPDDVDACERLARLYVGTKERDKSLAMHEHLMRVNPDRFDLYFNDGASLFGVANDEKAIAWAKKVLKDHPGRAVVLLRIARIHNGEQEYAEAIEYYGKAIAATKPHVQKLQMYLSLIDCQIAAEKYIEAEKTCREALALRILSPSVQRRVRNLLNRARERQGKPPEK